MADPRDVHSVQSVSSHSLATRPFLNPQLSVSVFPQHAGAVISTAHTTSLALKSPASSHSWNAADDHFTQPPALYAPAPPCEPQPLNPLNPSPPTCDRGSVVDVVFLHQQRDHVVREHVVQAVVDGQVRGGRLKQLACTLKRTQVRVLGGALSARGGSVGGKRACCDRRARNVRGAALGGALKGSRVKGGRARPPDLSFLHL